MRWLAPIALPLLLAAALPVRQDATDAELRPRDPVTAFDTAAAWTALDEPGVALEWLERYADYGGVDVDRLAASFGTLAATPELSAALDGVLERVRTNRITQHVEELERLAAEARERRDELDRTDEAHVEGALVWQVGHAAVAVETLLFSQDGERILSAAADGSVWLWEAHTGRSLAALGPFQPGRIECAFDFEGEYVLTVDHGAARAAIWDGRNGDAIAAIEAPDDLVTCATFSPSGRRVAAAFASGRVWITDPRNGSREAELEASDLAVRSVSFAHDGGALLTHGDDRRARLWELDEDGGVRAWGSATAPVVTARFDTSGRRIVLVTADGAVRVEDPRDPVGAIPAAGVRTDGVAPRPATIVPVPADEDPATPPRSVCVRWADGALDLCALDSTSVVPLRTGWPERADSPLDAILSPHGSRALVAGADGAFDLWDVAAGRLVTQLEGTTRAVAASFSPDGSLLAVGETAYRPQLYDAHTGAWLRAFEGPIDSIRTLAFSPSGDRVAAATFRGNTFVWDVEGGAPIVLGSASRTLFNWRLGLAPDGKSVVTAGYPRRLRDVGSGAHVWDTAEGTLVRRLVARGTTVRWACYSPGGHRIATAGSAADGTPVVHLWDTGRLGEPTALRWPDATPGAEPDEIVGIEFSANGNRLVALALNAGACLWGTADGSVVHAMPDVKELGVGWPVLAPDGLSIVSPWGDGVDPGRLYLWTAAAGARALPGHERMIRNVRFAPDGETFASSSLDGTARVWSTASGETVAVLDSPAPAVAWVDTGPDGLVVTADTDGWARVWDGTTGELVRALGPHPGEVRRCVLSADGELVLTLSTDRLPRIWTVADGALVSTLRGHRSSVGGAAFSTDGARVLTSSADDSQRLWDVRSGRLLGTHVAFSGGSWLTAGPDGHFVGSPEARELVRIRVGGEVPPLGSYAHLLGSEDAVREALAGAPRRAPRLPQAPSIEILAPYRHETDARTFVLEALLMDDYGLKTVEVHQDAIPLDPAIVSAGLQRGQGRGRHRLRLEMAFPRNRTTTVVRVRATNRRDIPSEEHTLPLRHVPSRRDLYLLALGVADYRDDTLDLAYPIHDVDRLVERFQAEAGGLYREVKVVRLVDDAVSPGKLRQLREQFLLDAGPDDTIVVFAAGHGVRSESGEYYFLTPTTTPAAPWNAVDRGLLESLVRWDKLGARRRVLLLDTCHAGVALGGADDGERKRGDRLQAPYDQREVDAALGTGLYIFAATSEDGYARESRGNGVFTRALLRALDGSADQSGDGDGLIEIDELIEYAKLFVREESGGRQRPTVPTVEGGENFPIARVPSR